MKSKNLSNTLKELHKLFDYANKLLFNSTLPTVIITIQSRGKRNAYGWFTPAKVWEHGEDKKHEINISAESINRGYLDVARTLIHEMIHLYCEENDIKDTSRGGTYHNKNFRNVSESHGFFYPDDAYSDKYGWSFSQLKPNVVEKLNKFKIDADVFNINRIDVFSGEGEEEVKKKSNIIKWQCGCGVIIRSSKDGIKVYCGDCGCLFEKIEDEN